MPVCHKHADAVMYGEGSTCYECDKAKPTAADLDAVTHEQEVKDATHADTQPE